MRTNYVLVDFENVQPEAMHLLDKEHFKTLIFCGANQGKINPAFVFAVQNLGSRAKYIQISGNGKNALDFHIAFYIGQLAKDEPDAYFHIISNDTGFDPLIAHLKDRKLYAERSKDITDIPLFKVVIANGDSVPAAEAPIATPPKSVPAKPAVKKVVAKVVKPTAKPVAKPTPKAAEKLAVILESLRHMGIAKPKTVKKLLSTINSLFQNKLQETELNSLLQKLQKQGAVSLDGTKVSYKL